MADYRVVAFKTDYSGRQPVDKVLLAPAGEAFLKCQTWHRVKDLMPKPGMVLSDDIGDSAKAMLGRWDGIGPAYEAWKRGEEIPDDGTPLGAWAGVTPDIAAELKKMGIRTVEEVKAMSPEAASKLPMANARRLPEMAGAYLAGKSKVAAAKETEALREQVASMQAALEELMAAKMAREQPVEPPSEEAAA